MGLLRAVLRHGFRGGCGGQAAEGAACRWPAPQPAKQEGDEEVRVARLQPWAALLSRTAPPLRSRRSGIEFHQSKSKKLLCDTCMFHEDSPYTDVDFQNELCSQRRSHRCRAQSSAQESQRADRHSQSGLDLKAVHVHVIAQSPLRLYISSKRTALQLQIPSKLLRRAPVYCARRVYTRIPMRICASPPSPPPLKEGGYFVFVWGV